MTDVARFAVTESSRDLAREVLIHGPIARAELARRLGLSPASLTRLSKPFLERGIFVEGPDVPGGGVGRPSRPLDVRLDAGRYIGIKVTGDEVIAVSTDIRANELARIELPLASRDPHTVTNTIATAVGRLGARGDFAGLGICVGGKVRPDGIVERAPFLNWRDVDLAGPVERQTGLPTTIENDVVALTAAEHWFGSGRGLTDFAVLTIGAGVGYGLVVDDRVISTPEAGIGLAGHIPLDPHGWLCREGHRGCSTAMLTIPALCSQASASLGRRVEYPELLRLAIDKDPVAASIVEAAGRAFGRMIALIANLAMVETLVLAGEGIALYPIVRDLVLEEITAGRDPDSTPVVLIVDDSGYSHWARGAAAVAIQRSVADFAR